MKDLSEEIFFRRSSNLLVIRERSLFRCLRSMLRRPRVCILCGAAEFECALGVWIVDKIIQCTDLADLEAFEAERRTDFFGVSRDEERAFVELQNQFALRFQQLVLESKAFSSTTERLERLGRKFDGLLLAISSLKAQRQSRRRSVTSERQSDVWSVKCVSAPSAPRGAPFCQVNPISNELMTKTGMSLRRGQPRSPSVLHWLVHTYYQGCLTFLRQCPGVPLWHLGCFGVRVFSVAYIHISDGAAAAVALGADPREFRPVFWLCT